MSIKSTTLPVLFFAAALFASCNNKAQPKQDSANSETLSSNGPWSVDSSAVPKAAVEPNAKDGPAEIKYKSGVLKAKGNFLGGKKNGEWQSFYEDGKMRSDEYFTNGLPDGKISVWYDNGQKMYEGEYKMGKLVGTWSFWNDKGALQRTADYSKKSQNEAF